MNRIIEMLKEAKSATEGVIDFTRDLQDIVNGRMRLMDKEIKQLQEYEDVLNRKVARMGMAILDAKEHKLITLRDETTRIKTTA